jgi:hypothetical protein
LAKGAEATAVTLVKATLAIARAIVNFLKEIFFIENPWADNPDRRENLIEGTVFDASIADVSNRLDYQVRFYKFKWGDKK